jgi:hypothetical protein
MRASFTAGASLAALLFVNLAMAQATALLPHTPPPAGSSASPAPDSTRLPPDAASLPLRLSLLTSIYPLGPSMTNGGCGAASVAAASTIFPTQPYTQVQLVPRLVLHGFSDLGCPGDPYALIDSGVGGGLTYAQPLKPGVWLVGSAGGYVVPAHDYIPSRSAIAGGIDLAVEPPRTSRVLTMGVGVTAPGRGVRVMPRFGGTF